jgi:hypothetical protein
MNANTGSHWKQISQDTKTSRLMIKIRLKDEAIPFLLKPLVNSQNFKSVFGSELMLLLQISIPKSKNSNQKDKISIANVRERI